MKWWLLILCLLIPGAGAQVAGSLEVGAATSEYRNPTTLELTVPMLYDCQRPCPVGTLQVTATGTSPDGTFQAWSQSIETTPTQEFISFTATPTFVANATTRTESPFRLLVHVTGTHTIATSEQDIGRAEVRLETALPWNGSLIVSPLGDNEFRIANPSSSLVWFSTGAMRYHLQPTQELVHAAQSDTLQFGSNFDSSLTQELHLEAFALNEVANTPAPLVLPILALLFALRHR